MLFVLVIPSGHVALVGPSSSVISRLTLTLVAGGHPIADRHRVGNKGAIAAATARWLSGLNRAFLLRVQDEVRGQLDAERWQLRLDGRRINQNLATHT